MIRLFASASLAALAGCAPLAAVGGAGVLSTALTIYTTAAPVLSDTAKLACDVQAVANLVPGKTGSDISTAAGALCAW